MATEHARLRKAILAFDMKSCRFSRHLSPLPQQHTSTTERMVPVLVLACFATWLGTLIYQHTILVLSAMLFLVAAGWMMSRIDFRRKRALAATRSGDPLCTLARSMDRRVVDPWVVRATFEELQGYFPAKLRPFPIRLGDHLIDDLAIDPEDIDDIAQDVAMRAGYSLENSEQNPLFARVETVGDFISFFSHQQKIREA